MKFLHRYRFFWVFLLIVFALPILPGAVAGPSTGSRC